jgi:polyisoprenoid-binding protein YceI
MKKIVQPIILLLVLVIGNAAFAQKYFTKSGSVNFFSKTPMENIDATNKKATCVIDSKTGQIEIALLMKAFEFEKALMQEHFNENYVESDKYPKATFKGNITNIASVNFTKDGSYPVDITGKLTMHGVTKDIKTKGSIAVKNGKINATTEFSVLLTDYYIEIPAVVEDKIQKSIKISATLWLEQLAQ